MFFDLLRDVRNGMVTFVSTSGKGLSKKARKSKHSAADILKKVKTTLHENAVRRSSPQPVNKNNQNGIHPADPGGARRNGGRDVETEPRQPRVMARITAVKQTPSNNQVSRAGALVLDPALILDPAPPEVI